MKKSITWVWIALTVITACITDKQPTEINPPEIETEVGSRTDTPLIETSTPEELVTITVVYTNDEHGWMAGEEEGAGAAELAGLWRTEFPESDLVLPLSGGDNWTGPAISTWFEGESMVEAMNAMGYAAAAVGNHEFDFNMSGLATRTSQANFPYLGANIEYKVAGDIPADLGIQPYTILDTSGLQIGIIGLANQDTPSVTNPLYVSAFEFKDYETALRDYVPQVREAGADLVLVPGHICEWELSQLARDVEDLEIALFGGGHCHELFANKTSNTVLLGGGSNLRSYAFATYEVATGSGEYDLIDYGTEQNLGGTPHPQVAEIVAHWQALTDQELDVTIGYLEDEIEQHSDEMAALITASWLWAYPADVAITNWGGMRDRIPPGEVTISDIVSVMPFENVLMDVSLTGEELGKVLQSGDHLPAIAGLTWEGGKWILTATGEPLDPEATYNLLVTDFLYAGGDNYRIAEFDPEAYKTATNWRQPVIDWILAQESSPEKTLDSAIQDLIK
ncbi:5'-nucleotidase C-terminal domain-containing protein [Chloroflexota bacterium]